MSNYGWKTGNTEVTHAKIFLQSYLLTVSGKGAFKMKASSDHHFSDQII